MERRPTELAAPTPEENYQALKMIDLDHMAGLALEKPDGSPITFPDGSPVYGYNFLEICGPARMALREFAQMPLSDPRRLSSYEGLRMAVSTVVRIVPKPGEA